MQQRSGTMCRSKKLLHKRGPSCKPGVATVRRRHERQGGTSLLQSFSATCCGANAQDSRVLPPWTPWSHFGTFKPSRLPSIPPQTASEEKYLHASKCLALSPASSGDWGFVGQMIHIFSVMGKRIHDSAPKIVGERCHQFLTKGG